MSDNKSAFNRVWNKVKELSPDFSMQKAAVVLAFMGCVQTLAAKTIFGTYVTMDGNKTEILASDGTRYQIESSALSRCVTAEKNKKGGDVFVEADFDENTSKFSAAWVSHSPVRLTSGIHNARWDIGNIVDGANELIGNIRDVNISRSIKNVADAVENYSPERVSGEGVVRVFAENSVGQRKWAQYHTVENGHLKPEYDASITRSIEGDSYTQSSSSSNYGGSYTQRTSSSNNSSVRPLTPTPRGTVYDGYNR